MEFRALGMCRFRLSEVLAKTQYFADTPIHFNSGAKLIVALCLTIKRPQKFPGEPRLIIVVYR